ncbi:Sec63 Brl domain-containing protein [Aspergillus unguis]
MRCGVNRSFSITRQESSGGTMASWKRRAVAGAGGQYPASSQSHHSSTFTDDKLTEGSQVSPFFSNSNAYRYGQGQEAEQHQSYHPSAQFQSQSVLPTPVTQDHFEYEDGHGDRLEQDVEFDAFDLELLAQAKGYSQQQQKQQYQSSNSEHFSSYKPAARRMEPSKQVSPFFSGLQVTPHRSLASGSSEIDIKESSSPLARLHPGGRTNRLFRGNLENQMITQAFQSSYTGTQAQEPSNNQFQDIPVSIRGIVLLSVRELPDSYRSLFHFPVFNAVQSKCFQSIYKSDDNVVLAAPTGSGKTVVMELAICRLLNTLRDEQFKVVYQAPTKSLCAERFRDWSRKLHSLGLQCAELTGDTDHSQLRNVQNSQIIITTPEKWDSMTRKWKDHARLMQLVKLFLIDEVHTLKEARGATLEVVVSRMKNICSNVRFVALSATIPNSEDIATWIGRNATSQHVPAHREHFGEEFRPVKLQKFVYGHQSHGNDFAFDKLLNSKLPDVISTHSAKKPIMIFCCTRNSAVTTAKELARLWTMSNHPARMWKGPNKPMAVSNADLKTTTAAGVAFHHAGLEPADRQQVENGYLEGKISIICCTSTLAVGVNLPCHLVIIKNTVGWQDGCCQEYSDLEVMQMLGRAGRPQFDDSATAVILTRKERVNHYERLVSGSEGLESCLHLNLIDHLNAEIGLGNVTSIESATAWLAGTFLFVRLRRNPTHYNLKEGANRDDENEMLRQVCEKDIKLLQDCDLVESNSIKPTPFGDAMARYHIRYETMKALQTLKPQSGVAQILSVISKAEEFHDIRLKAGEKSLYKELNRSSEIIYPINVDIALPTHKISLLVQSELGAVEFPSGEQFQKHKFTFQHDKSFVFSHINRIIRCIIDCQVHLRDSVTVRNALELARSLTAKVWDNSPLQMKQIEQIGVVAVRKLVAAGIDSIEALEDTEPHRIDMALSKNPPFGMKLRSRLAEFPKLRVSVKMMGKDIKPDRAVSVRFRAEIAFMNEKCPSFFQRRPVYVCFVAETSDGRLIDFRRMSATKLQHNQEISLSAELKQPDEYVTCHVMCDEIAGTARSATLKPDLPRSCFPKRLESEGVAKSSEIVNALSGDAGEAPLSKGTKLDRLDTDDLLFGEWLDLTAEILEDWDDSGIKSNYPEPPGYTAPQKSTTQNTGSKTETAIKNHGVVERQPEKLNNGRWLCNHKCKDKTACKHLCCREGLSNPPKATRKKSDQAHQEVAAAKQLTLSGSITKKDAKSQDARNKAKPQRKSSLGLSDSTQALLQQLPLSKRSTGTNNPTSQPADESDYGDESFDDLPDPYTLLFGNAGKEHEVVPPGQSGFDLADAEALLPLESTSTYPLTRDDGFTKSCPVDLISPEPQEIFSTPATADDCGGQKRKLTDSETHHDGNNKRIKSLSKDHSICPELCIEDKENFVVESMEGPGTSLLVDIPTEWEGIDPALLNDFKDIVEFF